MLIEEIPNTVTIEDDEEVRNPFISFLNLDQSENQKIIKMTKHEVLHGYKNGLSGHQKKMFKADLYTIETTILQQY